MAESGKPSVSWLQKVEEQLDIDVDSLDSEFIQTMPKRLGVFPHDSTSNQLWVDSELHSEANAELLRETAKELKDQGWLHIYTRVSVLLCKRNIANLRGRVLLQTLPSKAYDKEATLAHARLYDAEFARAGIPRSRYCIKIPATGPALNAARALADDRDANEGLPIATLGTAIFGLPQAIAASQAQMLYISPYLNELPAHFDNSLWPDVADPATQHPMSARVVQILDAYRRRQKKRDASSQQQQQQQQEPLVKLASFLSAKEVLAAAEFGCHSATVSTALLDELARLPYDGSAVAPKPAEGIAHYAAARPESARLRELLATVDPQAAANVDRAIAGDGVEDEVDYLADNGEALRLAIEADVLAKTRLADALEAFTGAEEKSRAKIEAVVAAL